MQELAIPSRESRISIAERIVELSSGTLSRKDNQTYIALQVGTAPYCNAVSLSWRKDRVSFYVPSGHLVDQARTAGFDPVRAVPVRPLDEQKYRFHGLKLADLQKYESLFRAIIKDSMDYVLSQKPKQKR